MHRHPAAFGVALLLAACGGGGGGSSPSTPAPPASTLMYQRSRGNTFPDSETGDRASQAGGSTVVCRLGPLSAEHSGGRR